MLKAAFIGAGSRSRKAHYPIVHRLKEDVEVAAVCELNEEFMQKVVDEFGIPRTYTDHRKMLEEVEPDIVYCVMNEKWLLQPALDCLNAGSHLFVEKPVGKNLAEAEQILEAAKANDVSCTVGFQRRYADVTREAMRLVNESGAVSQVSAIFNKRLLGEEAFNVTTTLWNDVCHIVDLVRYMSGGEPVEVTAYRDKFGSDHYNSYVAMIRFDNDATGVIFGNRASGARVIQSELHGVGVGCYMKLPDEIVIAKDDKARTVNAWEINGVEEDDTAGYAGELRMHRHLVDCVQNGKIPNSDLRDAIKSIRLVNEIEAEDMRG